jgi:hypothetical protein
MNEYNNMVWVDYLGLLGSTQVGYNYKDEYNIRWWFLIFISWFYFFLSSLFILGFGIFFLVSFWPLILQVVLFSNVFRLVEPLQLPS